MLDWCGACAAGVDLGDGRLPRLVCAGGVFAPRCTSAATSAAALRSDDGQTLTMADDWQSAFTEAEYDAIILGTGMKECLISGLLSVEGKKVRVESCSGWEREERRGAHGVRSTGSSLHDLSVAYTHTVGMVQVRA